MILGNDWLVCDCTGSGGGWRSRLAQHKNVQQTPVHDSLGGKTEGVAGSADPNTRSLLWESWGWGGAHQSGTKDMIRAPLKCFSSWRQGKTERQGSTTQWRSLLSQCGTTLATMAVSKTSSVLTVDTQMKIKLTKRLVRILTWFIFESFLARFLPLRTS